MKLQTIFIYLGIFLAGLITGMLIPNPFDKPPKYKVPYYERPDWKGTDTVYTRDTLFIPKPYPVEVPPHTVIIHDTVPDPHILVRMDSLLRVLDSTNKKPEVPISLNYIKQYPKASKLIMASFKEDTISLSLLNIDGKITSNIYPVNYKSNDYLFLNNSLSTAKRKTRAQLDEASKTPFIVFDGTYINYKRDFINRADGIDADIGITLKDKLRFKGYGELWINGPQTNSAGLKVGYRLF